MQFSFDEIELMHVENRQEARDATPFPLAGRTFTRAESSEVFRILDAWKAECEVIAVRETKLRVNDSDWASYRDQLSRRQKRMEGGRSNPAKEPGSWDLFEDDPPKLPRSFRRAKAREAAVEEWLAAPPNPFD
ncbi:MAG: hypothetical protein ACI9DE_001117 [Halioglobus sp.]|jgi:hypothetical protein